MTIKFTPNALQRLDDLADYIYEQSRSKKVTAAYLRKLRSYIVETLSHFPKAGRPSDNLSLGTRKLVYQGFSIVYRRHNERIDILTLYKENLP